MRNTESPVVTPDLETPLRTGVPQRHLYRVEFRVDGRLVAVSPVYDCKMIAELMFWQYANWYSHQSVVSLERYSFTIH